MAITKEVLIDKIETLANGVIQTREATVIKEDGVQINRSFTNRKVLNPSVKTGDTWGDTDISGEDARVQAVCNAVWTDAVKSAYQKAVDANTPA